MTIYQRARYYRTSTGISASGDDASGHCGRVREELASGHGSCGRATLTRQAHERIRLWRTCKCVAECIQEKLTLDLGVPGSCPLQAARCTVLRLFLPRSMRCAGTRAQWEPWTRRW